MSNKANVNESTGISVREWLAGMAMQAIISTDVGALESDDKRWWVGDNNQEALARHSVACAEALIAQLEKGAP